MIAKLKEQEPETKAVSLQAGRELRALVAKDTYTAELAREAMARGELLPLFMSISAFAQYAIEQMTEGAHLLVDGFPRSADQLLSFDSAMQFYGREVVHIVYINISDTVAHDRLGLRSRSDDSEESIKRRLAWSRDLETEVHDWFKNNPRYIFHDINGEQSVKDVSRDIFAALDLS